MRKIFIVVLFTLTLPACNAAAFQQPEASASLSQIQTQCFASYKVFAQQVRCIEDSLSRLSGYQMNLYAQEYVTYLRLVAGKVKKGNMGEDEARYELASKMNELKRQQDSELAQGYLPPPQIKWAPSKLEVYKPPSLPPMVSTSCSRSGQQINCTSR